MPSHYLNQCWSIVNWTLRNKLQWNLNWNSYIFIQETASENAVCKIAAILSWPQYVQECSLMADNSLIPIPAQTSFSQNLGQTESGVTWSFPVLIYYGWLIHLGWENMTAICRHFIFVFLYIYCICISFWFKFHWNMFPRVWSTISHIGNDFATNMDQAIVWTNNGLVINRTQWCLVIIFRLLTYQINIVGSGQDISNSIANTGVTAVLL